MDIAPSHEKKNSNILKHVISRIFIYPLDIATHSWYNSLQGLRFTTPRDKNTSHHITQYISFTYMYIYLCKKKLSNIREVLPEFQTYKHSKSFVTFTMKENLNRLSSMYSVQKIFFCFCDLHLASILFSAQFAMILPCFLPLHPSQTLEKKENFVSKMGYWLADSHASIQSLYTSTGSERSDTC